MRKNTGKIKSIVAIVLTLLLGSGNLIGSFTSFGYESWAAATNKKIAADAEEAVEIIPEDTEEPLLQTGEEGESNQEKHTETVESIPPEVSDEPKTTENLGTDEPIATDGPKATGDLITDEPKRTCIPETEPETDDDQKPEETPEDGQADGELEGTITENVDVQEKEEPEETEVLDQEPFWQIGVFHIDQTAEEKRSSEKGNSASFHINLDVYEIRNIEKLIVQLRFPKDNIDVSTGGQDYQKGFYLPAAVGDDIAVIEEQDGYVIEATIHVSPETATVNRQIPFVIHTGEDTPEDFIIYLESSLLGGDKSIYLASHTYLLVAPVNEKEEEAPLQAAAPPVLYANGAEPLSIELSANTFTAHGGMPLTIYATATNNTAETINNVVIQSEMMEYRDSKFIIDSYTAEMLLPGQNEGQGTSVTVTQNGQILITAPVDLPAGAIIKLTANGTTQGPMIQPQYTKTKVTGTDGAGTELTDTTNFVSGEQVPFKIKIQTGFQGLIGSPYELADLLTDPVSFNLTTEYRGDLPVGSTEWGRFVDYQIINDGSGNYQVSEDGKQLLIPLEKYANSTSDDDIEFTFSIFIHDFNQVEQYLNTRFQLDADENSILMPNNTDTSTGSGGSQAYPFVISGFSEILVPEPVTLTKTVALGDNQGGALDYQEEIEAERRDTVTYKLTYHNPAIYAQPAITIVDTLPKDFGFLTINGLKTGETHVSIPGTDGDKLEISLGEIAAGETRTITYTALIGGDALAGGNVNTAKYGKLVEVPEDILDPFNHLNVVLPIWKLDDEARKLTQLTIEGEEVYLFNEFGLNFYKMEEARDIATVVLPEQEELVISKTVVGEPQEDAVFTFNIKIWDEDKNDYIISGRTLSAVKTAADGVETKITVGGESAPVIFSLKDGESIALTVELGEKYIVAETIQQNYKAEAIAKDANGTKTYSDLSADGAGGYVLAAGDMIIGTGDNTAAFTNTYFPPEDITATKVWINGPEQKPEIQVELYRTQEGGTEEKVAGSTVTLSSGATEHTWENMAVISLAGKNYTYRVDEVAVPTGYTKKVEGFTITNTYTPAVGSITLNKTWELGAFAPTTGDLSDAIPYDQLNITFTLTRDQDGETFDEQVKKLEGSSITWDNLPLTDNSGTAYTYTITEDLTNMPDEITVNGKTYDLRGYSPKNPETLKGVSIDAATTSKTVDLVNEYSMQEVKIKVQKTWVDERYGRRFKPTVEITQSITNNKTTHVLALTQTVNGDVNVRTEEVEIPTSYALANLYGVKFEYSLTEDLSSRHYTATIVKDPENEYRFMITNTATEKPVNITLIDETYGGPADQGTEAENAIPKGVRQYIFDDMHQSGTYSKHMVRDRDETLPRGQVGWYFYVYQESRPDYETKLFVNGVEISADQLVETPINGGASQLVYKIESLPEGNLEIKYVNTYIPPKADIIATKTWEGGEYDGIHPNDYASIGLTFTLKRDRDEATLAADAGSVSKTPDATGTVTWENIPKADKSGVAYTYTVEEAHNLGSYKLKDGDPTVTTEEKTGTDGKKKTVITHAFTNVYGETSITVKKLWENGFENPNYASLNIKVELTRKVNGVKDDMFNEEGTLNDQGEYTWTVPLTNDDDVAYEYVAEETKIAGQTPQQAGFTVTVSEIDKTNGENWVIEITNTKDNIVPTGIQMSSLPYVLLTAIALMGMGMHLVQKRRQHR